MSIAGHEQLTIFASAKLLIIDELGYLRSRSGGAFMQCYEGN